MRYQRRALKTSVGPGVAAVYTGKVSDCPAGFHVKDAKEVGHRLAPICREDRGRWIGGEEANAGGKLEDSQGSRLRIEQHRGSPKHSPVGKAQVAGSDRQIG